MSVILYGKLIRRQKDLLRNLPSDPVESQRIKEKAKENKLATLVAALVPVEIIALHGFVLSLTTTTTNGTTTITHPEPLKWSLLLLIALAAVGFLFGRRFKDWQAADLWRLLIALFAVVAWTGIIGISALTPWVTAWNPVWVAISAGSLGVVLVWSSAQINPPESD